MKVYGTAPQRLPEARAAKIIDVGVEPAPPTVPAGFRPRDILCELMPFQRENVWRSTHRARVLIADDPGLGKTIQAIALALLKDVWPVVVVVPGGLTRQWAREIMRRVKDCGHVEIIRSSREPTLVNGRAWYIVGYELLRKLIEPPKAKRASARVREMPYDLKAILEPKFLILDECHYTKNYKSQQAKACQALASRVPYRVALSGTPAIHGPSDLIQQLTVLGILDRFGGFWHFIRHFCAAKKTAFGWDTSGASNLKELNTKLREICMVRNKKRDVLLDLPPRRVAEVWVNAKPSRELQALKDWVRSDEGRDEIATGSGRAEALRRITSLRSDVGLLKVDTAIEWARNFLEGDEKLVIFTWHREVAERVAEALGSALLLGGLSAHQRDYEIQRFVGRQDCRSIVATYGAGGTGVDGLQDVASNALMIETGWTPKDHDQAEGRLERIGVRGALTFWYLLADGSIDEEIWATIEEKRGIVGQIMDGTAQQDLEMDILPGVLKRLARSS